jgi:hypothetical protein
VLVALWARKVQAGIDILALSYKAVDKAAL